MAAPTNAANVKKVLANPEPSTHGTKRTCRLRCVMTAVRGKAENLYSVGAFPFLDPLQTSRFRRNLRALFLFQG
jgi:hypothetical protein